MRHLRAHSASTTTSSSCRNPACASYLRQLTGAARDAGEARPACEFAAGRGSMLLFGSASEPPPRRPGRPCRSRRRWRRGGAGGRAEEKKPRLEEKEPEAAGAGASNRPAPGRGGDPHHGPAHGGHRDRRPGVGDPVRRRGDRGPRRPERLRPRQGHPQRRDPDRRARRRPPSSSAASGSATSAPTRPAPSPSTRTTSPSTRRRSSSASSSTWRTSRCCAGRRGAGAAATRRRARSRSTRASPPASWRPSCARASGPIESDHAKTRLHPGLRGRPRDPPRRGDARDAARLPLPDRRPVHDERLRRRAARRGSGVTGFFPNPDPPPRNFASPRPTPPSAASGLWILFSPDGRSVSDPGGAPHPRGTTRGTGPRAGSSASSPPARRWTGSSTCTGAASTSCRRSGRRSGTGA